ncbi:pyrimidine 5'-nucleotidase [Rhizobium sp.]
MTAQTSLPAKADFAHVTDWVFDLDNTLYPHHVDLFAQIDKNMTAYVANLLGLEYAEARALQKKYYYDHGTTLAGLMHHHAVDPHHFLDAAHAIDYSPVLADPDLADAIKALPGRKFIFTNGTVKHAEAAARALGVLDHFEDIFDIVAADFVPKPANATYDKFASLHRVDTKRAAMFEDLPRNLIVPRLLGMKTILIQPLPGYKALERWEEFDNEDDNIDFATDRLSDFLKAIV